MTYLQAVVIGLLQGLTELFPISSLGHTVLVPAWLGGTWATLVRQESRAESPYLAFIVSLHLATAAVLIGFYWRTWLRVGRGLVTSIARRQIDSPDQRLAWLLIIATIPVGIAGLLGEHTFRVLFAKPEAAAIFLTVNGGILLLGERYRRRGTQSGVAGAVRQPAPSTPLTAGPAVPAEGTASTAGPAATAWPAAATAGPAAAGSGPGAAAQLADPQPAGPEPADLAAEHRLARVGVASALWIGAAQILALLAGISREGVTMAGGLLRGLS
ncbi:MAG: undecaprenyl-diphosphate phosphatase, partial [Actinomycetota bacterium]